MFFKKKIRTKKKPYGFKTGTNYDCMDCLREFVNKKKARQTSKKEVKELLNNK